MAVELVDGPLVRLHKELEAASLIRKGEALMVPFFNDDSQTRMVLARGIMRSLDGAEVVVVASPLTETTPKMLEWLLGDGWVVDDRHHPSAEV